MEPRRMFSSLLAQRPPPHLERPGRGLVDRTAARVLEARLGPHRERTPDPGVEALPVDWSRDHRGLVALGLDPEDPVILVGGLADVVLLGLTVTLGHYLDFLRFLEPRPGPGCLLRRASLASAMSAIGSGPPAPGAPPGAPPGPPGPPGA